MYFLFLKNRGFSPVISFISDTPVLNRIQHIIMAHLFTNKSVIFYKHGVFNIYCLPLSCDLSDQVI